MTGLLDDLVGNADLVLIDGPPLLTVADSLALAAGVDGVIIVADARTPEDAVLEAHNRLVQVGAVVVAVVLDGFEAKNG
jgi:Mrp family chromosome partitioning ATPase